MPTNEQYLREHLNGLEIKHCAIAVGGSLDRDIDLIYVADKICFEDLEVIRESTEKKFKKPVSVCPLTHMMIQCDVMTGKCARMFYKGVTWVLGFYHVEMPYERMRRITLRNAPEELSRYVRKAGEGNKDKMFELLIQLTSILIGETDGEDVDSDKARVSVRS